MILSNRYEIIKIIGTGGMADVYLANDLILKREVAIKVLKKDIASDPISVERFKREALAISKINHLNIVDIYDVGFESNRPYIVMEYINGITLKNFIKKRGALDAKEAVWIIKQIAFALLEAHKNKIIHRDIKSQNILIKEDGTIKITDFGIAQALDYNLKSVTKQNVIIGSVHYLAPEIAKGKSANMQSDIYSLGIIFYELLTGKLPFDADSAVSIAVMHTNKDFEDPKLFNPSVTNGVKHVLYKACAKNLENRYENVALMIKDLNNCLNTKVQLSQDNKTNKNIKNIKTKKKTNNINSLLVTLTVIISFIMLFIILVLSGVINLSSNKSVIMPDIIGMNIEDGQSILLENNITIDYNNIERSITDDYEKDLIYQTSPNANETIDKSQPIKIYVSKGKYMILKSYENLDVDEARKELIDLGFNVELEQVDGEDKPHMVVGQSLMPGSKYDPSISNKIILKHQGYKKIAIESYVGLKLDEVESKLNELNLKYEKINKCNISTDQMETYKNDVVVVSQDPLSDDNITIYNDTIIKIYYYSKSECQLGSQ